MDCLKTGKFGLSTVSHSVNSIFIERLVRFASTYYRCTCTIPVEPIDIFLKSPLHELLIVNFELKIFLKLVFSKHRGIGSLTSYSN